MTYWLHPVVFTYFTTSCVSFVRRLFDFSTVGLTRTACSLSLSLFVFSFLHHLRFDLRLEQPGILDKYIQYSYRYTIDNGIYTILRLGLGFRIQACKPSECI